MNNTTAIILLSLTFSDFEPANEIIRTFTEEDDLDGNAYDCWMELDAEFDDDGVYDRVVLEEQYDNFKMLTHWSPSRFITQLKKLRKKLKRVGHEKR